MIRFCPGALTTPRILRLPRRFLIAIGLLAAGLAASGAASAATNFWVASNGQSSFNETRSGGGQLMAGRWWDGNLENGKQYRMTFRVTALQGAIAVRLGNGNPIEINAAGTYNYEFPIVRGAPRRLLFQSLRRGSGNQISANVRDIAVTEVTSGGNPNPPPGPQNNTALPPKGHYLSFSRERNLKTEMLDIIDNPGSAQSGYHLGIARDLEDALKTPGVKGFSVEFNWRSLETGDGRYDWRLADANMLVAERFGLRFILKIQDRSFDGQNIMPAYFPGQYVLRTSGGGKSGYTAKRWDPYVYNRLIRLHKAIAQRYNGRRGFGGIATTETAPGNFSGGGYSVSAYRTALTQVANQTLSALTNGSLFWSLNFLPDGVSRDMNKDTRVAILRSVNHQKLVIGAPDITPDANGMPGSLNGYRIHMRKTAPGLNQFCQLQHTDQGRGNVNKKTNQYRQSFFSHVNTVRNREKQSWFTGPKAVFEFDDLRDSRNRKVDLHPSSDVGKLWHPEQVFLFANRNFDCDYALWHYRENVHNKQSEYWWPDIQPIILRRQTFFQ